MGQISVSLTFIFRTKYARYLATNNYRFLLTGKTIYLAIYKNYAFLKIKWSAFRGVVFYYNIICYIVSFTTVPRISFISYFPFLRPPDLFSPFSFFYSFIRVKINLGYIFVEPGELRVTSYISTLSECVNMHLHYTNVDLWKEVFHNRFRYPTPACISALRAPLLN